MNIFRCALQVHPSHPRGGHPPHSNLVHGILTSPTPTLQETGLRFYVLSEKTNSLASLKYKHLPHHECILTKVSVQPQLPHDAVCYIVVYRHVTGWM